MGRRKRRDPVEQVPLNVIGHPMFARCDLFVEVKEYRPAGEELEEFAHNALVLALPPYLNRKKLIVGMQQHFVILHKPSDREGSMERKLLGLSRIGRVWVVLRVHIELMDWIHVTLRARYYGFRPVAQVRKEMQRRYEAQLRGEVEPFSSGIEAHADCKLILGLSGTGKSTAALMAVSMLPIFIKHTEFEGEDLRMVQAVWVYVTCPHNGSLRTFLEGILEWFDMYLGTHLVEEMSLKANTADYMAAAREALNDHFTGLLIIDEIQNVLKAADKHDLIDFLTNLLNDRCCSVLCLGTEEAESHLKTLRVQRRVSNSGITRLAPFKNDEYWEIFCLALMKIDFLPEPPDEDALPRLREILYDLSAGIPAIAKLIWKLTQYLGIVNPPEIQDGKLEGYKVVSEELMRVAASTGLGLVKGMVTAVKKRDMKRLSELSKLAADAVDEYLGSRIPVQPSSEDVAAAQESLDRYVDIVSGLIDLGFSEIEARSLAHKRMADERRSSANDKGAATGP